MKYFPPNDVRRKIRLQSLPIPTEVQQYSRTDLYWAGKCGALSSRNFFAKEPWPLRLDLDLRIFGYLAIVADECNVEQPPWSQPSSFTFEHRQLTGIQMRGPQLAGLFTNLGSSSVEPILRALEVSNNTKHHQINYFQMSPPLSVTGMCTRYIMILQNLFVVTTSKVFILTAPS